MNRVEKAKAAYGRYGAVTDFKNYQGLPMPTWAELPDTIRRAWIAAANEPRTPKLGDVVHAHVRDQEGNLVSRPAIVVRRWGTAPDSAINLQVLTDNSNDFKHGTPEAGGLKWITSAQFQPDEQPPFENHWFWPIEG